ncbi:MAG: hypothetical protein KDA80_22330, partial [Planctomycetaceae bacterium]|nr:hypothetical protein [Planctomycetaceae bacterium]
MLRSQTIISSVTTDLESPETQFDYPAAHSMDTTWYAVDAEGHLGVFDTGENGWVPAAWNLPTQESTAYLREQVERLGDDDYSTWEYREDRLPLGILLANGASFCHSFSNRHPPLHYHQQHIRFSPSYRAAYPGGKTPDFTQIAADDQLLYFLEEPCLRFRISPVRDLLMILPSTIEFSGDQLFLGKDFQIVLANELTTDDYVELHENGTCRGCFESRYGPSYPHSDIGLYVYGFDSSFGKENFVRILAPLTPLRIQELPDGIQSVLRNVEFLDLTFA